MGLPWKQVTADQGTSHMPDAAGEKDGPRQACPTCGLAAPLGGVRLSGPMTGKVSTLGADHTTDSTVLHKGAVRTELAAPCPVQSTPHKQCSGAVEEQAMCTPTPPAACVWGARMPELDPRGHIQLSPKMTGERSKCWCKFPVAAVTNDQRPYRPGGPEQHRLAPAWFWRLEV